MTSSDEPPVPDVREFLSGDERWRERFPDAELVREMEGGAVFRAETPEGSWLIVDEGTMVEFLDPEDAALAGVSLERYATRDDRDRGIGRRLPRP